MEKTHEPFGEWFIHSSQRIQRLLHRYDANGDYIGRAWWLREYVLGMGLKSLVKVSDLEARGTRTRETAYHPAIIAALETWGRPSDWHQLLLEMGRRSQKYPADTTWLAFTPSEAHGRADKQTLVKVNKYLTRHWPNVASHHVRDLCALHTATETMEIWRGDVRRTIAGVELGPRSCMKSTFGSIPFTTRQQALVWPWMQDNTAQEPDWDRHPYSVYTPELGWAIAVRYDAKAPGCILGRALVYERNGKKCFVRSYARNLDDEEGYSHADTTLAAWLEDQGYEHADGWPRGAEIEEKDHPHGDEPLLPYVDGYSERRYVYRTGDGTFKFCSGSAASDHGSDGYQCDNTDGTGTPMEDDRVTCDDCGDRVDADETSGVGPDGDGCVCHNCINDNYRRVVGRGYRGRREEYYVHEDRAAYVEGGGDYYIDPDNCPDDVVALENGKYAELDDTICVEDEYYLPGDDRIVELDTERDNGDTYALRSDTWVDGDGNRYHDEVKSITYDGDRWVKADAWQCEATGLWYPEHVDQETDPETGDTVGPDFLERVSRQADFVLRYADGQDMRQEMLPEPLLVETV